jgi:cytochrome c551/c552
MRKLALVLTSLALTLAACGGDGTPDDTAGESTTGAGDTPVAADGEDLYKRTVLANNGGCITCHSLTPDKVLVGPSLAEIGRVAAERIPGTAGRDYLLQSIINPDAFVVDGFEPGRMPADWVEGLADDEIAAIVDYMLTLGAE